MVYLRPGRLGAVSSMSATHSWQYSDGLLLLSPVQYDKSISSSVTPLATQRSATARISHHNISVIITCMPFDSSLATQRPATAE